MQQKKILLVEDSPLPQQIVKTILQQLDCRVDSVSTGEEAVILCYEKQLPFNFYGYWTAWHGWYHGGSTDSRTRKRA